MVRHFVGQCEFAFGGRIGFCEVQRYGDVPFEQAEGEWSGDEVGCHHLDALNLRDFLGFCEEVVAH